ALGLARLYAFRLQIGPASAKSIVKRAQPLNEESLERFYSIEGLQLRVVLFSSDFDLLETEKTLRLPRPPEESEELSFALRTPKEEGRASLRACVYFRGNLLQSLHVHAWITTTAGRLHRVGNEAIVDFALTSSFVDLEELPDRAVCFASNQDDSTNSFFVHGENLTRKINLENLAGGVADARKTLTKVCAGDDLEKPRYQFGADNLGTTAKFIESAIGLARMGSSLYVNFVTRGQDRKFEDDLQTALAKPSTIQVAVTREASHVFPWALVYDKRLVQGNNTVCPQFLADLKAGAPLDAQTCLVNGCRDVNPNVVCPSAFWGFRHVVEQPLSIEEPSGAGATNIVLTIPRTNPVPCLVGVSQELPYVGDHKTELTAISGVTIDYKDSKVDIGTGLQRRDVSIVYFYCHGGRTSSQAWLGVGKKEQLFPADLHGWKVDWPTVHPLVFINGCNTVAITPDDLLPFNRMLAWSRAAGVIGTEIQIPEDLAREFGRGFLVAFIAGQTAGAAIRALRLKLLQKYNPLGLAYTLYCSADLRLN
ncbi:MAG TPA: CHAT domain-containing protein, partial [Pyrinomonadaceae bacterium]|nr:CHAT domain-containing protein [Pyrinomonadaceae bacterium]